MEKYERSAWREKTGNVQTAELAVPALSSRELPGLPRVPEDDRVYGGLEPGAASMPEVEALELARDFEREFDLAPEDVRPCVAAIFFQGVLTEREPYAFLLGLELHVLGVSETRIEEALRSFSGRLARPLKPAEIAKFSRKFTTGRYDKRHSCQHAALAFFCIGEVCPWHRIRRGKAGKGPIMSRFYSLGWPAVLRDSYSVNLYLGLHHLRQLKSLKPTAEFRFNYRRIQEITGLGPARVTERLKTLQEVGLVDELTIGTKWGGPRQRTRVRLAWPIPEPPLPSDLTFRTSSPRERTL